MSLTTKPIIFLHIPKTGGISLSEIAKKQYSEEETVRFKAGPDFFEFKKSNRDITKIKYIQGHIGFGFHDQFSIDATYVTMLRNPIDRVVSNYYFILQNEKHFLHKELHEKNYNLIDYVESGIGLNTDNCQVRYLSGNIDIPHNTCTKELLEIAINNLDNSFSVFGVQEHYNAFLILMSEIHGWKIPYYKKYNITKKRKSISELDNKTIDVIKKYNEFDLALYNYAKVKFETQIKERGDGFQRKLHRFENQLSVYQKLSQLKNRIFPG